MTDTRDNSRRFVYHLARRADWQLAIVGDGRYRGSPQDRADGFLHFSTREQIVASAARHRAGEPDLLLLCARAADLGAALRFEPSRNGELFPHLHGDLDVRQVTRVDELPLDAGGRNHVFPALLDDDAAR